MATSDAANAAPLLPSARDYQQEMLQQSLQRNIVVAMDTGSGKTLIAVLRIKAFLGKKSLSKSVCAHLTHDDNQESEGNKVSLTILVIIYI